MPVVPSMSMLMKLQVLRMQPRRQRPIRSDRGRHLDAGPADTARRRRSSAYDLAMPLEYSVRNASLEDAPAIAEVVNEVNIAEVGFPLTSVEEARDDLTLPGRDEEDDVVLLAQDGDLVGYLTLWPDGEPVTHIQQMAFVRPTMWGRGLSTYLLRLGEERALAKVHRSRWPSPIFLRVSRWASNDAAELLFASLGYTYARTFHVLRKELDRPIPTPEFPDGIALRTFERERDAREVHAALVEAFADHWSHDVDSFDRWEREHIEGEASDFDAGLWFVALSCESVIGAICCRPSSPHSEDAAVVQFLGVRSAWRGRGIGRALLVTAFAELRQRGIAAVELGVDSGNQTGATQLYEKVGMRTLHRAEYWEKIL